MFKNKIISFYNTIINLLSFYPELYKIRRLLNTRIDQPDILKEFLYSHPRGFIKTFQKRRITIVESYLKIIHFLDSNKWEQRLSALKLLAFHMLHSKALKMPLNTARVQLALMKECVKSRDNKRHELELLRDFSISSFGQSIYIKKYLDELNIIEVPETGQQLKDLNMGWDFHVHDNFSYGRKTPTQLIIDAFIKGISEITIAHNNLTNFNIVMEAIIAGRILGIKINIGIEFSVGDKGKRFHYMYLFPYFETVKEFKNYFIKNKKNFDVFIKKLKNDQKNRLNSIENLINNFNNIHLPVLNEGYDKRSIYYINKLNLEDIAEIIPLEHATKMHLGELLFTKSKTELFNRVMNYKSKQKVAEYQYKEKQISLWEYQNINKKYKKSRRMYVKINPEYFRKEFFSSPELTEYKVHFKKLQEVSKLIDKSNQYIKIIHPIEHGLKKAIIHILENYKHIRYVEIYNMYDSINRDHNELMSFAHFIDLLNKESVDAIDSFIKKVDINFNYVKLTECVNYCNEHKIIPTCGSDSTGRISQIPGMGFIFLENLTKKQKSSYVRKHFKLPITISNMLYETASLNKGKKISQTNNNNRTDNTVISMGKSTEMTPNLIGDENIIYPIPINKIWRYLNPVIKIIIYIAIGFIPTYLILGLPYALLWFGITGIRNIITDLISGRGYSPKDWHIKNINFENLSKSLFFSGFSVPLLAFVKAEFDLLWFLTATGLFYNTLKFFFICFINGLYLATHNTLRGFDKIAVRGNFFRSVLAWPFATIFAPVGDLFLIPSIVQAKLWTDIAGGFIEGTTKFFQLINLDKKNLYEIISQIFKKEDKINLISIIDLLYFFQNDPRSKNTLKIIFFYKQKSQNILKIIFNIFKLKKATPDETNEKEYKKDFLVLLDWFSDYNNLSKLIRFILKKHKPEQSVYLVELVSNYFIPFHEWLLKFKE